MDSSDPNSNALTKLFGVMYQQASSVAPAVEKQAAPMPNTYFQEPTAGFRDGSASVNTSAFGVAGLLLNYCPGDNPQNDMKKEKDVTVSQNISQLSSNLPSLSIPEVDIDVMSQQILVSTKLLAAIDPSLAAKVVEYALSLSTEQQQSNTMVSPRPGATSCTDNHKTAQAPSVATISVSNHKAGVVNVPEHEWTLERLGKLGQRNPAF